MTTLGQAGLQAFERRGISVETAARYGIYTAEFIDGELKPSDAGNIVVFPFWEHDVVVNEKYRGPQKKFWQKTGGKRTFWNADVLDDPVLEKDGGSPLIITEGEIDALTAIDCGYPLTVSVPDGAPPVKEGEQPDDVSEVTDDRSGKFEFMWNNRDRLKRVKRFIIATDSDHPGQRLAAELVRRLSASRCSFVSYPEGCKDLNDVLMKHGSDAVRRIIASASPYPVKGLYRSSEYPDLPPVPTATTGWWTLDVHLKPFVGEFMVVTGIPSHGKSTWVLNLLTHLADRHQWRSAIFSPEMPVVPHLRDKLRRIRSGSARPDPEVDAFIDDSFVFIDTDPRGGEFDDDFDLEWIIDKAKDAVMRYGIRILLIDPWNEVEHAKRRDETMTEYIGRGIRMLKRFAREYDVAVIVVAHPTKDVGRDGKLSRPTLYDVDGSAHWFNKPDHGVIIHRPTYENNESEIHVAKVRFDETGEKGLVKLKFDRVSCRYETLDA